jgi:hypothetical protein
VGVHLNGGGEGIAEAPRSVWRTRFYEYFMETLGADMAHYPKKIFCLKEAVHLFPVQQKPVAGRLENHESSIATA